MFITFEGVEGAGKTTHLTFLADYLRRHGISILVTREPGGTPLGDEIRHLVLKPREETIVPMAELFLMFSARAQHIETVVKPALAKGQWVLCDRFVDSSYAYQGAGRGIAEEVIGDCERLVVGNLKPNYTWIFDASPEIGLQRIGKRGSIDRIENEKIDFFNRIRECYLRLAARDPKRYRIIDGSKALALIEQEITQLALDLIHVHATH